MKMKKKALVYAALALAAAVAVAAAFRPEPVKVDLAQVRTGPLAVAIEEDGEARAKERYVLVAPVAGRVARIDLRAGDAVEAGQTLAQIFPLPLSARERVEQTARIAAAEALVREAANRAEQAQVDLGQRRRERERTEALVRQKFVSPQAAEQARSAEAAAGDALQAARARQRAAAADAEAARAALLAIDGARTGRSVSLRAPVSGRVLRIEERSERVVPAGQPLITVGDPKALEVVVDLLSQDAVKVRPGMPVRIEGWGGSRTLMARVRTVEPFAFTKVSALGVEEQRVNVVADFVDAPGALGDGYRVEAAVVIWSEERVLKLPASAVFRDGERWAVFAVEDGRARRRQVEVGQRSAQEVQILSGVAEGMTVVRHPSNALGDGARVAALP
jgi:HlyD family secretion protein